MTFLQEAMAKSSGEVRFAGEKYGSAHREPRQGFGVDPTYTRYGALHRESGQRQFGVDPTFTRYGAMHRQNKQRNFGFGVEITAPPGPVSSAQSYMIAHPVGTVVGLVGLVTLSGVGIGWLVGKSIGAALLGGAAAVVGFGVVGDSAIGSPPAKT